MKDNGLLGEYKIRERTKVRHTRHTHPHQEIHKHQTRHWVCFDCIFAFIYFNRPWSHVTRQPVHITFYMWIIRTVMVASSQLFITWIFIGMLYEVVVHSGIVHCLLEILNILSKSQKNFSKIKRTTKSCPLLSEIERNVNIHIQFRRNEPIIFNVCQFKHFSLFGY